MSTAKTVEAILNKEDKAIEHIIQQNKDLFQELSNLKNEMKEMNDEKEEIERDNDSLNKSRTIMQGYLKNIYEMNKIENKLKKINHTMFRDLFIIYYITIFFSIMFNVLILNIEKHSIQYLSYFVFTVILIVKGISFYKYKKNNDKAICKLNEELLKTQKATDLVNDLFDNM